MGETRQGRARGGGEGRRRQWGREAPDEKRKRKTKQRNVEKGLVMSSGRYVSERRRREREERERERRKSKRVSDVRGDAGLLVELRSASGRGGRESERG